MMPPRYPAPLAQQPQQQQQSTAGYQYYTPVVHSQYPSVAVPPPALWIPQAAAAMPAVIPGGVANHYVMPQQLQRSQPAVCATSFCGA